MVIFHCTVHNAASPADNKERTEGMWHCMFVIFHSTKHTSFSLSTLINAKNAENKLLLVLTLHTPVGTEIFCLSYVCGLPALQKPANLIHHLVNL